MLTSHISILGSGTLIHSTPWRNLRRCGAQVLGEASKP
uniref:Uncharacterized protein n=1 Tax=Arundo donax TaxID=35708 RepID=A0A0A9G7F9_ARUDO